MYHIYPKIKYMIYNTTSKIYKEMLVVLSNIAGKSFNPNNPYAQKITMHRAGRLVWKLVWTLEVRNETMKAKGPGVWRYRLQVDPVLRVNKKSAKLDFSKISPELHDQAKRSLEGVLYSGPFFKGMSAITMKHFENGKGFLWGQVEHWQKYYSTVRKLTKDVFFETIENECPSEFKTLIQNQK